MNLDRGDVANERHIADHDPRDAGRPTHERKDRPPAARRTEGDPGHRRHQCKGRPLAQFRDGKALHSKRRCHDHQNGNRHFAYENQYSEPHRKKVVIHGRANTNEEHCAISNRIKNLAKFTDLLETTSDVAINPIRRRQQAEEPTASNHSPVGKQTHKCRKHGKPKQRQRIGNGQIFTDTHTAMVAPSVVRDREWT